MQAQKAFYEKIEQEMGKRLIKQLEFWQKVAIVYMPAFALAFVAVYWFAGLSHAGII